MLIIAHRGNLSGCNPDKENNPEYLDIAINNGFDVEIDLRVIDDKLFLGHDLPQYEITMEWLENRRNSLWIHCKDAAAFRYCNCCTKDGFNYFWHNQDQYTLTSFKYIWAYPGVKNIGNSCISVLPKITDIPKLYRSYVFGVCTDFAIVAKELITASREI